MKWFKHDSNAHNDEKIRELIHEFGCEGYGVYMIILELISEKIDQNLSPLISISDRVLREKTRVSHQKLTKILPFFDRNSLIFSNFSGKSWELSCPNLLNRIDNWTKNQTSHSQVANKQVSPNKKIEEEQEEEREVKREARPRSLDDVKTFFKDDKEAENFWDYFQSNGWKVGGRAPMKDWQAAARRWIKNSVKKVVQEKPRQQINTMPDVKQWARDAAPPPGELGQLIKNLAEKK